MSPARRTAVLVVHAYANPRREGAVAASNRERLPEVYLTLSPEVLPGIREFERTSTTVANACVMPVLDRYLILKRQRGSVAPADRGYAAASSGDATSMLRH